MSFSVVEGAPPVTRQLVERLDQIRRTWAVEILVDPEAQALVRVVVEAAEAWGDDLPRDFPKILRVNGPASPGLEDLGQGLATLIRSGFVLARGVPLPGITVSSGRVSMMGKEFVRHEEGLGPVPYWPGGSSGVTIGPGYDLGSRDAGEVRSDLSAIGVDHRGTDLLMTATGLIGQDARSWVRENRSVVRLSVLQQEQLFASVVPRYEEMVTRSLGLNLGDRLFQHEFDALLSLAWNTSHYGAYDFNRCVDRCDLERAAFAVGTVLGGGPGIPMRRHREVMMLTYGSYVLKPMMLRDIDVEFYDDMPRSPGNDRHAQG